MYVFDGMFYLAKLSVAAAGRLSVHVGIKRCIFTVAAVRAEKGEGVFGLDRLATQDDLQAPAVLL